MRGSHRVKEELRLPRVGRNVDGEDVFGEECTRERRDNC